MIFRFKEELMERNIIVNSYTMSKIFGQSLKPGTDEHRIDEMY